MDTILCIGVDVSSRTFETSLGAEAGKTAQFPNNEAGFAAFAAWCGDALANALVVCEATGGYEAAFIGFLVARDVRVHRATPYLVKSYIRSLGLKAKTDRIDARALARYGAERGADLAPYRAAPESQRELAAALTRREELVAMRVAETNRSRQPLYADPTLARSVAAVLATLNSEIAGLEAHAAEIVAADPRLKARFDALTSIPGVGRQTALVLQARMPELGRIDRRAAASLAGCAPHPRDSGITRGRRTVWGGRASLKRALFMAAMAARNHDPIMRAFFERLVHNGKPKMVAIVAVMRKIVVIANARVRTIDGHATG
jgi:transposase